MGAAAPGPDPLTQHWAPFTASFPKAENAGLDGTHPMR
jgi:hypothetical protein